MNPGDILKIMPEKMRTAFLKAEINWDKTEEIRIRAGKPVFVYVDNREYILENDGELSMDYSKKKGSYIVYENDIRQILDQMTGYSIYAYEDELRQGFFTLEGGHRVGVAGKTVIEKRVVKTLKEISFMNIRIAHEKKNCGRKLIQNLVEGGQLKHTLLISPPRHGKDNLAS